MGKNPAGLRHLKSLTVLKPACGTAFRKNLWQFEQHIRTTWRFIISAIAAWNFVAEQRQVLHSHIGQAIIKLHIFWLKKQVVADKLVQTKTALLLTEAGHIALYQALEGGAAVVTLMFVLPLVEVRASCSFKRAISLSLSTSTFLRYSTSSSADILLLSRKLF